MLNGPTMRHLFSCLLLLFVIVVAKAQSAQGRYHSRLTPDGTLFFIQPHKLNNLSGIKSFSYDVTLLNWQDSATVNFTFESDFMEAPSNLQIVVQDKQFICKTFSPLYIDIKKNHYVIRITSKFSVDEIGQFCSSDVPPVFSFDQGDIRMSASYKPKAWISDRKKLNDIFKLYSMSR
ncbi:MAG: hypothetical protein K2L05_01980 [Muribaculaceae bacterium]|nr:hypothetical protein [Muribaculaceae bacterium]